MLQQKHGSVTHRNLPTHLVGTLIDSDKIKGIKGFWLEFTMVVYNNLNDGAKLRPFAICQNDKMILQK